MTLSRDKYVPNTTENVEKLVRKVMEGMDFDTMWQSAYQGLTNHYRESDHCFIEDYYETFPDEDPDLNGTQEEEYVNKIIYYHGHHSNPCVVGEIFVPKDSGFCVIMITHDILCKDYGDNLSDISKVWDSQTKTEVRNSRYDTSPDKCIHIPLDMEDDTSLSNQVLNQILLNNNIELVKLNDIDNSYHSLEEFSNYLKNV